MATYQELMDCSSDSGLRQRMAVACVIAAEAIRTNGSATTAQLNWAREVYAAPTTMADKMMWPVLAQNAAVAKASILGATDAALQTAVSAAVAVFAV